MLRYSALQALEHLQRSPVKGLAGARTSLIPHQLYIANEVASRFAPRVLLADEIGLGKTIEAGLIIHQQMLTHRARRVLIVVPQQLVHQWFVEMIRRFNLHFSIFDDERVRAIDGTDSVSVGGEFDTDAVGPMAEELLNPFMSEQLVLCSTGFLASCDIELLRAAEWDLLVVDEAHHLQWSQAAPSIEYQRVAELCDLIPGLLLLTATPEQLGIDSHFSRLHLLDAERFHSLEAFRAEQTQHQNLASIIEQISESDIWSDELKQALAAIIGEGEILEDERPRIVRELIDRHGTGRVMFRNTRRTISGFPARHVHGQALPMPDFARVLLNEVGDDQSVLGLLNPEAQFSDDNWCRLDSRVVWLQDFLKQNRREKVLVICASKGTAVDLESHLRFRCGMDIGVFHEDLDIISRDRAAAWFADSEDGAQALICSEIGSEGRNFQFAHLLVLFDLPLNPDLLEQRIGRLDRIGQDRDIEIFVPYYDNHPQQVLFRWYQEGCNAFETTNPAGGSIFEHCEARLIEALHQPNKQLPLLDFTRSVVEEVKHRLDTGRDRLLELSSYDEATAQKLMADIRKQDERSASGFSRDDLRTIRRQHGLPF